MAMPPFFFSRGRRNQATVTEVCTHASAIAVNFRRNALCFATNQIANAESSMRAGLSAEDLLQFRAQLEQRERELIQELSAGRERASTETFSRLAGEVPDVGDASVADTERDGVSAER